MDVPSSSPPPHPSLGLEKLGFAALAAPWLSALLIAALTGAAVMGFLKLKIDDFAVRAFPFKHGRLPPL